MKKKIFAFVFVLSLVMSACGSSPSEAEIEAITTAAAQTVEARFAQEAEKTPTPEPTKEPIEATPEEAPTAVPPAATPTLTTGGIAPEGCLVASLVSETVPDMTVLGTDEYFTKTWTLQNNGECTWNQEHKFLYWDGDLLGGYTEYNFPDIAQPGETINIPIQLKAPSTPGIYTGYWKMQSRSGYIYGVGEYNAPVSVKVDVRQSSDIEYGITSVEYFMIRDPEEGCPANVLRTIYAVVSVSGPMEIRYQFYQRESDGEIVKQKKQWLRFDEAGTKTIKNEWKLNKCVNAQPRYVSLVILDPDYDTIVLHQYPEFVFVNDCPDQCE